jgi:tetratricopeptide (TPR) repeat protein
MHTIFRIIDISQMETRLWLIELQLTNDKDEQLNELLQQLRSEIYVPSVFNVDKVGKLCLKMGDYDGALEVYETLLRSFPDNQVLLAYVHQYLGLVYQYKNDRDQAIVHYEKTIEIRRLLFSENEVDEHCIVTYANLSGLYVNKGDLSQARKYCELALNLYLQVHQGEKYNPINHCYHLAGLAFIQQAEKDFENALANYEKVVDLRRKYLSPYHPDLVVAYSNLATAQGAMQNHIDSIQSLKHALDISIKSLPDNHESLATIHYNMAIAYDNCQQYDHAFKHIQSAIQIAQQLESFDQDKLQYWSQLANEFEQNSTVK